jgi:DNA-binding CsgD family transcriptional regulator
MYTTATQTRQLSALLATLTEPGDAASLRQRLCEPLAQLLNADYVASLVWDEGTQRFGQGVCCHADAGHLRAYEAQYQFSDPIAPLLHARRYPTLFSQVIPQRELVNSAFFDRFLNAGSMYWGVNLYAHNGQQDVGDLRIWRGRSKHNFDSNELEILRTLYPCLVNALTGAQIASTSKTLPKAKSAKARTGASAGVQAASGTAAGQLAHQHGLSRRETQIAQLVALGCTDKEIAKRAGIAYTTVRTYLGNTLAKTGLGNRKELISYLCSR